VILKVKVVLMVVGEDSCMFGPTPHKDDTWAVVRHTDDDHVRSQLMDSILE
jgi:hypothetical protein